MKISFPFRRRRSRQMALFTLVATLVLGGGALHRLMAQQDLKDVQIKVQHVAGTVYMLEGRGGNIGVSAGPDGLLMVDDQFAPLAGKIRAALASLHHGGLAFVLNTHHHGDHVGGNVEFGPEAPIIAHENVRKRLSTRQETPRGTVEPSPKEALPVITFEDSVVLHFNDETIEMVHYPSGHTDGDSVVFFTGSNVVHMGDDFFAGRFPFVDLSAGGNVLGMTRDVQAVLDRIPADAKIIPGHGPLSTVKDLEAFHRMLMETTAIVSRRKEAGEDLEAIKKEGLPQEWDEWGSGFINTDRWLETVYKSL
ncbi:MAG: MBL fold metallo-hydrolase [Acidobacteriota bacterium]